MPEKVERSGISGHAGRRRRGVFRACERGAFPPQDRRGYLAQDSWGGPQSRYRHQRHPPFRAYGNPGRTNRTPPSPAQPAGCIRRVPGVHSASVPSGKYPPEPHAGPHGRRCFKNHCSLPLDPGQFCPYQGILGHVRPQTYPGGPSLRRRRPGGNHCQGKDRSSGRSKNRRRNDPGPVDGADQRGRV